VTFLGTRIVLGLAVMTTMLLTGLSGFCRAQQEDSAKIDTDTTKHHCLCFKGAPLPNCRAFFIIESGLYMQAHRFDDYSSVRKPRLGFDLGLMRNFSSRYGLGITGYLATDEYGHRAGIKARYRRWLSDRWTLDISPGLILSGDDRNFNDWSSPGYIGAVSLGCSDLVILTAYLEVDKYTSVSYLIGDESAGGKTVTSLYVGASAGSYAGVVGLAAVAALSVLIAATW